MTEIKFFETPSPGPLENWYAEPFTKRTSCQIPGQCGGDCNCGCPYNTMTEVERLPLIEDIARIFPNEWLAFIIAPGEDDDFEPTHGKLIAHSPDPDEVADAVNTVLWNQHVYVYFNGDFTALQASYGPTWEQEPRPASRPQAYSGPTQAAAHAPLASDPLELIYSALDQLYGVPKIHEAIRRLRLARVKMAATRPDDPLVSILDTALNKLETSVPLAEDVIWYLEEALANLELV